MTSGLRSAGEGEYITIGGKNNNASHGARDQSALLLRQGYDVSVDKRLQMNRTGAILAGMRRCT